MNEKPPAAEQNDRSPRIPPVASPRYDEALIDQAVAETFPASDPISPAMPTRPEPGDVRHEQHSGKKRRFADASFNEALDRAFPALVGIATAAAALLVMRAFSSDDDSDD